MDQEQLKHVGDALSVGTVVATIAGWLPAVAALVTIIWTGLRIFETQTVQKLLKKFRNRKE
jgi:peptidoglycan biosynthesis protein MviN/MurJ (putative lipid II flippase)